MRPAYYNEIDAYAAQWLRNLIAAGHLPAGDVDTRSIVDVRADDLAGYGQCHFFAGIGGWALAARLAGWPDSRPLWTGSCPCQPFSVAGKQAGTDDARHLWPDFFRLIRACRPDVVMGEQVAAAVGKDWLDGVFADLEGIAYAGRAAIVPACAVNAPHRRDRVWFVARSSLLGVGIGTRLEGFAGHGDDQAGRALADRSAAATGRGSFVEHADFAGTSAQRQQRSGQFAGIGCDPEGGVGNVADHNRVACGQGRAIDGRSDAGSHALTRPRLGGNVGLWNDAAWVIGHDGKARRVEPSIYPLAHGVPARVGRLRAYGNAIVPEEAAQVIGAYLDMEAEEWGDQPLEAAA